MYIQGSGGSFFHTRSFSHATLKKVNHMYMAPCTYASALNYHPSPLSPAPEYKWTASASVVARVCDAWHGMPGTFVEPLDSVPSDR